MEIYYLTYLKDTLGNNYLGLKIPNELIEPYLNLLYDELKDEYDEFIENKQKRDNYEYHITVINVFDFNKLSKQMGVSNFINSLIPIFEYEIDDLNMIGLGYAEKEKNKAYFIVCESNKLDAIRTRYNLSDHDFHITLGFKEKDVFGVRKNLIIKK